MSAHLSDIDLRIEAEQIRHIYSQTLAFVPVVMLAALFTIIMLWPTTSAVTAIGWCLWIWLLYAGFWILCRRWQNAQPDDAAMKSWARPYILLAWIATASWGVTGILFYHPDSFVYQSLLFIILVASSAAITATSTAYSPTFYPVVLMLLPLFFRLIFEDEQIYQLLAFSILIFTSLLFFLHRNSHSFHASALRLRFVNEELARQLAIQKDIAEQANTAKSKFLAAASHDLRQPLHALELFHGELAHCDNDRQTRKKLISRIGESIHTLNNLFDGLMDVSRFEVGVVKPNIKVFNLNELFESLRHEYIVRAQAEGLSFHCVPCNVNILSDPLLLRRIVRNLLENAIRYTHNGRILLGCRRTSDAISLQVWDTGIGIAEEELQNIFIEFQQLNNPEKQHNKGLGLGLSVVRQLAMVLGHPISVQSSPDKGSMFSLKIKTVDNENPNGETNDNLHDILDSLTTACILVIDSDEDALRKTRDLLSSWGSQVLPARNIESAIAIIQSSNIKPDIIISNTHLKDRETGIDAIIKLRKKYNRSLPAVLISDSTTEEIRALTQRNDIMLLENPVKPSRLATLLRFTLSDNARKSSSIME